jgi:superoxide dismutase
MCPLVALKADSLSEDLKEEIEATWGSVDDLVDEVKAGACCDENCLCP